MLLVETELKRLGIFVAYTITWLGDQAPHTPKRLGDEVVADVLERVRHIYGDTENLKNNPVIRAYRNLYWRLGIDPTKVRPSSEALIRRALRGSFPRINPVVDAGNVASALTAVPIGIYDLDYVALPVKLTFSKGGERFKPIGGMGEVEIVSPQVPILVDSKGLILHVYPHRDSIDTMVRESTRKALIVAAGAPGVPIERVVEAVNKTLEMLREIGWEHCEALVK